MKKFFDWFDKTFNKERMSDKQYMQVKTGLSVLIVLVLAILAVVGVFAYHYISESRSESSTSAAESSSVTGSVSSLISSESSTSSDNSEDTEDSNDSEDTKDSEENKDSDNSSESASDSKDTPQAQGISVTYSVASTWENAGKTCYQVEMSIKNNTAETLPDWKLTVDAAEGDTVDGWNGTFSVDGKKLTVTPAEHNKEIYAGGSVSVGFILTTSGSFNADSIKVNDGETTVVEGAVSGDNNQQQGRNNNDNNGNNNNNSNNGQPSVDVSELLERSEDAVQGDDWLYVEDNKIVDKDGKEVWITGVNWFGYNTGTNIFDGLWGSELVSSVTAIADHGFNLVRIPFSAELINQWAAGEYPQANYNQAYNSDLNSMNSLEIFDYVLKLFEANGMKVMIDIHCAKTDASGHNVNLWYNGSITAEDYYKALEWMAERYKDNDTIVAYDLKNEPHGKPYEGENAAKWDNSTDENNWKYAAETAAARILAKNPNVLIMVEGIEIYPMDTVSNGDFHSTDEKDYYFNWWGGNLRGVKKDPIDLGKYQNKLVYSPHDYGPTVYQQPWFEGDYDFDSLMKDCWQDNWFYIYKQNIAPLLIGEWGGFMTEPNITWMTYMRQLIKENHLHHTFWCYNANSGDTGGLVLDDFTTWDEEKYAFVKEVLWQQGGKFVGLDHAIPLGKNGITLSEANSLS